MMMNFVFFDSFSDELLPQPEVGIGVDKNRSSSHEKNLVFVHHKIGIRNDDLITRIDEGQACKEEASGHTGGYHYLLELNPFLLKMEGDLLP